MPASISKHPPLTSAALCLLASVLFSCAANATEADAVDYATDIKPILATKCYACHGVLKQESDLRLETRELMIDGGVIEPGNAKHSLLFERVSNEDERMPPDGEGSPLTDDELKLVKLWIEQGAEAPDEPIPESPKQHWAFQKIERPNLPPNSSETNPIDAFLNAKRRDKKLQPRQRAPKTILLRRLHLNLTGLPPTREQLHDDRAWETIVDELLASEQHAERWARHWMDVWRYSDWYGLGAQLRYSQKHLWHWRDWIIESLIDDKGYDQMILEMLAGDEIAPTDPETYRATGFLARNYYLFNRTSWLDNTIEHTGKAFLGLTINCAKCHDHKYDPISQLDYYQLRAIFEPHQIRLDHVPGEMDPNRDGIPRAFDDHLGAKTFLHIRGDEKNPDKELKIAAEVPQFFSSFASETKSIDLPGFAFAPGSRDYVQRDQLAAAREKVAAVQKEIDAASSALKIAERKVDPKPVSDFAFRDEFDRIDKSVWNVKGKSWVCEKGSLSQTKPTREKESAILLKKLPRDFEMRCRYTTTGGTTYKSVTFSFDASDDGSFANYVYTSAFAGGAKVQAAFTRDGKSSYPREGVKAEKIDVGTEYELRMAIRDRLVNVWLDDRFILAYEFPQRKPEGSFKLSGFDATVDFNSIEIQSLGVSTKLTAAKNSTGASGDPKQALELATKKLAIAESELASLEATIVADNVIVSSDASPETALETSKIAAAQQTRVLVAKAEYELAAAGEDEKQKKAATVALTAAKKKLNEISNENAQYKSLVGSLKALETPAHKFGDYSPVYAKTSSGRRTALASWIVHRDNPLTARVAVNQVWMRHFGKPLVESVFDFGLRAPRPQHDELLDWLAAEFIDSGWSFRRLHKLIVTSEAYQQSSSTKNADANLAIDPENKFYWHMPTKRMESQLVRDSLLSLAGKLDQTVGGPSVNPSPASKRRSIYFVHSAAAQDKFLSMFDDADLMQCYRRQESIIPQQALALSNSKLAIEMAEAIASKLQESHPNLNRSEFIELAFETLLARSSSSDEKGACIEFCNELSEATSEPASESLVRKRFVHALLNHNDFVTIR